MKFEQNIKTGIESILSLVYYSNCNACQSPLSFGQKHLCLKCQITLPYNLDDDISKIFWGRLIIHHSTALLNFEKGNVTQNLLHGIKYKNKKNLAQSLGEKLGDKILTEKWENPVDLIIPIPLHPKKKLIRGYNQATIIAKGIAKRIDAEIDESIVKRITANITQTKKNKYERWGNVKQVFTLANSSALENKHVLIVDDAITTGATLEACIRCLQQIENCKVSVATLAIAK